MTEEVRELDVIETLEDLAVAPDPSWGTTADFIPTGSTGTVVIVFTTPRLIWRPS